MDSGSFQALFGSENVLGRKSLDVYMHCLHKTCSELLGSGGWVIKVLTLLQLQVL